MTEGSLIDGFPYLADEWRYGLRCMECDHAFSHGEGYSRRLVAFQDDSPVSDVVCIGCATASVILTARPEHSRQRGTT